MTEQAKQEVVEGDMFCFLSHSYSCTPFPVYIRPKAGGLGPCGQTWEDTLAIADKFEDMLNNAPRYRW
jgi:hypothetical protein